MMSDTQLDEKWGQVKNKRTPVDTLYLSSRGTQRTLTLQQGKTGIATVRSFTLPVVIDPANDAPENENQGKRVVYAKNLRERTLQTVRRKLCRAVSEALSAGQS